MKAKRSLNLIFAISYLSYTSIYIARLNFTIASALFEAEGVLLKEQIGLIGSIFSFVYAVSKIPNGYFGDKRSTKKIVVTGLLLTGLSNVLIGLFPNYICIALLWGVNAYGQSMLWGALLRTFSEIYDKEKSRRLSGYLISSVAVGNILGIWVATKCAYSINVSASFIIPGVLALIMAAASLLLFTDVKGIGDIKKEKMTASVVSFIKLKEFRQVMIPAATHGMIRDNVNIWMAVYFVDTFGMNIRNIAGYLYIIPVFAFAGRVLYPVMLRILRRDSLVSVVSFAACIILASVLCVKDISIACAIVLLGCISALVSIINTHLLSAFPLRFANTGNVSFAASMMDLVSYGGAGIGSVLFGFLIPRLGYGSMFGVWGIAAVASVIVLLIQKRQDNAL